LVAGDLVAAESHNDTLKTILTRSRDRGQVFAGKVLAVLTYTFVVVFALGLVGLLAGSIAWGFHPLTSLSGTKVSPGHGLVLLLASLAVYTLPLAGIAAFGVLLSTVTRNSAASVVGALMWALLMQLLSVLPGTESFRPYLLGTQFEAWHGFLRTPADWVPVIRALWVCALYIAFPLAGAYLVFLRRDTPGRLALGINPLAGLLADELLRRAPASLGRVLFTSSGTESVEAAIKVGRAATGRTRVVSVERGFHGLTLGSLSASGEPAFTRRFGPLLPGFVHVPYNDLDALEAELRSEDVALFLIEPVIGHGAVFPEPGYLEGAQALGRRYGTLLCVDEVQTGLGRTGRMFALEHWGLKPDV